MSLGNVIEGRPEGAPLSGHHEPRELGRGTVRGDARNTMSLGNGAEGSPEEVLGLGHHEPREWGRIRVEET